MQSRAERNRIRTVYPEAAVVGVALAVGSADATSGAAAEKSAAAAAGASESGGAGDGEEVGDGSGAEQIRWVTDGGNAIRTPSQWYSVRSAHCSIV